jgi:hypothetical protein
MRAEPKRNKDTSGMGGDARATLVSSSAGRPPAGGELARKRREERSDTAIQGCLDCFAALAISR